MVSGGNITPPPDVETARERVVNAVRRLEDEDVLALARLLQKRERETLMYAVTLIARWP